MGRVDDVINVSGHRLGTAEVESALVSHEAVAEAAVVGRPDEIKGQAISAFVTLEGGRTGGDELKNELRAHVAKEIGALAKPDDIRFTDALPKTRSGKIMRRLLREIDPEACGLPGFHGARSAVLKDAVALTRGIERASMGNRFFKEKRGRSPVLRATLRSSRRRGRAARRHRWHAAVTPKQLPTLAPMAV